MKNKKFKTFQSGLSLIELMVGVAIGLFIVGGATTLFVDNLSSNRQLLVETRVNQNLRVAADVIARDLRRATYWDNATTGLWVAGGTSVSTPNPYNTIDATVADTITYSYNRPTVDPAGGATLGFRRTVSGDDVGTLEIRNGSGGWQPLTDPDAINITSFTLTPTSRAVELWTYCSCRTRIPTSAACTDATLSTAATRPQLIIRQYAFEISGQPNTSSSTQNAAIQRQINGSVRVRNDELKNPNGCPVS